MAIKLLPVAKKDDAEIAKVKEEAMHGLSMLGLDNKYLSKPPRRTAFPSRFHPDTRKHWDSMFADKDFNASLKCCRDPVEQWQITIRRFISRCGQNGCDPFATHTNEVAQTPLYRYLSGARARICKFMDSVRLFEVVRFSDVERKYVRRENNFEVYVSAKITGFGTLENLTSYLSKVGFRRSGDIYVAFIDGTSCVKIDVSKPNNVRLCYEIKVGSGFTHPKEGKVKLKNKQYDDYVTKNIWLPIVRTIKFNTLKKKALF